jgi:ribose transport system ATP-binding protein
MAARLRVNGIEKSFGATRALANVSMEVAPGEVHALIGENGAGKSTLMKILSGAERADAGSIELDGQPFTPENPLHASRSGVAMIYQELTLAPHLTVAENIVLGAEPSILGWINGRQQRDIARKALAELHHDSIPLDLPVRHCTIAEQQIVEIARALVGRPRILIMDEPTSSLTRADVENLFHVIERLRSAGVSIIYISHFLEECQRICDRYTVLRDGQVVGSGTISGCRIPDLVKLMVGRDLGQMYPKIPHSLGSPLLEARDLQGLKRPRRASFTLKSGEILGVAGLIGSGRTETLRTLFGLDRLAAGQVEIAGRRLTKPSPSASLRLGAGLLSENRKEEGLMLIRSISENLLASCYAPVARCGILSRRRERETTRRWIDRLTIRSRGADQPIGELSGGNQQKVAIARLLHSEARILLLDEPTRGIDVGSKAQIYELIGQLAADGKGILFVSSYLPELLGICDTIGVMCRGVLSQVRPASEWTEASIISAAIGQTNGAEN